MEMQLGAASPCIVSPGCGNALRRGWEPGHVLSHSSGLGSVTEPSLCHAHSLIEVCFYTPTALNVPIKTRAPLNSEQSPALQGRGVLHAAHPRQPSSAPAFGQDLCCLPGPEPH